MIRKKLALAFIIFFYVIRNLSSIEPPNKLIIQDIIIGKENVITENDKVSVHYKGWLFDSSMNVEDYCQAKGEKFDDSSDKDLRAKYGIEVGLFSFQLGQNSVIPGWEVGFKNMKVGGKRCLVIPPRLGYGAREIGNIIPPYSTLIFEIDLININSEKEKK